MSKNSRENRTRKSSRAAAKSGSAKAGVIERLPLYLSRSILFVAVFVLFVPLIVSYDFYYPFVFLKSILFRAAVQIMSLLYVILAVVSPSYRPRFHRIVWGLLAYFGAMAISSLPGISISSWSSWWGDFARMGGMFTQLHLLAYFMVLAHTLKREHDWLTLFSASLFSGILMGFSGLIQFLDLHYLYRFNPADKFRTIGATGNANWIASHMVLNFFIGFWFLSRKDRKEVYPVIVRVWVVLLMALDLCVIVRDVARGEANPGILSSGSGLLPVVIFAAVLHGLCLTWYFLRKYTPVGTVVLGILGLYYLFWIYESQTRSAVVGLVGSLVFLSIFYIWAGASRRVRWVAATVMLTLCLLAAILLFSRQSKWIESHATLYRYTHPSLFMVQDRVLAWKAGALGILERPILGSGLENYKNVFDMHFEPRLLYSMEYGTWYDRAHNFIIDVGTTTGLTGLAACFVFYWLILVFLIRSWFRTRDVTNTLLIAALLLAYLFQSLFTFDTVNTDGVLFLLLAYISFLYSREQSAPGDASTRALVPVSMPRQGWLVVAAAAALAVSAFWYLVREPYASNLLLNRAIALGTGTDAKTGTRRYVFREEIPDLFVRANDYRTTGRYMVREELANYASEIVRAPYVPLNDRVDVVKRAMTLLEESIRQEPFNVRHYLYLATLVNKSTPVLRQTDPLFVKSALERNLVFLTKAESLSPSRPQIYFEKSQMLAALGRRSESCDAQKKGVDLNPTMKEPHLNLFVKYVSAERYDDAAREWQVMKTLFSTPTPGDYTLAIRLYNDKKQFASVADLYREQLAVTPNDPALLTHLAMTYRDMGEVGPARETAIRAASLSPDVKARLQSFLNSLAKPK